MPSSKLPNRRCTCGCGRPGRYLGRLEVGGESFFLGYFATKQERQAAREQKRGELGKDHRIVQGRTCASVVAEYLSEYEETHKLSSLDTARQRLRRFTADFGPRPIDSITRSEAKEWARVQREQKRGSCVPMFVTLFNWAVDEEIVASNPFRKLGHRSKGRADKAPPTIREFKALLDACDALGDYGGRMRDFLEFAAYTLMRPGELFELRWSDVDFKANQIHKDRRLYRGLVDVPKTGRKTIPLPPPARDILMRQPTRAGELVFLSKQGKRLTAPTVSQYWANVKARARLDFDIYAATKHYGVHVLMRPGCWPARSGSWPAGPRAMSRRC
jgi:integrase